MATDRGMLAAKLCAAGLGTVDLLECAVRRDPVSCTVLAGDAIDDGLEMERADDDATTVELEANLHTKVASFGSLADFPMAARRNGWAAQWRMANLGSFGTLLERCFLSVLHCNLRDGSTDRTASRQTSFVGSL